MRGVKPKPNPEAFAQFAALLPALGLQLNGPAEHNGNAATPLWMFVAGEQLRSELPVRGTTGKEPRTLTAETFRDTEWPD